MYLDIYFCHIGLKFPYWRPKNVTLFRFIRITIIYNTNLFTIEKKYV